MKTESKRHLGRVPVTTYLPKNLTEILQAKAARKASHQQHGFGN